MRGIRGAVRAAVLAASVLAIAPCTAAANNLFTLDPSPTSPGHVIQDAGGNAYVTWTSQAAGTAPEPVRFCKVPPGGGCNPTSLPIPGAVSISDSVSGALAVLGPGSTVYVVGPRYAQNDVIVWTSTNGGASFDSGSERNIPFTKTEPTDVFIREGSFVIGGFNSGLGLSTVETAGPGGGSLSFAEPGAGGVASSSMGLSAGSPVIAYWNISQPPYPLLFYRHKGGSLTSEASWEGPLQVGNGYEPSLAGGPAGLFMVSQDYSGGQYPDAINLRRFEGTGFGAPRTLAVDPSVNLFAGGAIDQSPSGTRLAVAWPGVRGDGANVMRLYSSADGGATFTESHVARIGSGYAINDNAELAIGDGGAGWLLFTDGEGLKMADLTPIAPDASPAPLIPPIYKGKTRVFVKKVGAFLITLRLPRNCLRSRQRFFAGVGKRKRRALAKKLGGKLQLKKVAFFYDGRRLRLKKRKPFRYLIDPGAMAPGSVHVVKVRVTAILEKGKRKKRVIRTLKGTVKAC